MPFHGSIIVIKRSGTDGSVFPFVNQECVLGRDAECDIRIQLPVVSNQHAKICVNENQHVWITALGQNGVEVNRQPCTLDEPVLLKHKDVFMIGDRFFRWEYPKDSPLYDTQIKPMSLMKGKVTHKVLTPKSKAPTYVESLSECRKRVSFGPALSPEYIDKTLPPSTPVKKGAVISTSSNNTSLLLNGDVKTPPVSSLKRRLTKRVAATPTQDTISEDNIEPKDVLVRHLNDSTLMTGSSGSRTSPRNSFGSPVEKRRKVSNPASVDSCPQKTPIKVKTPTKSPKMNILKTPIGPPEEETSIPKQDSPKTTPISEVDSIVSSSKSLSNPESSSSQINTPSKFSVAKKSPKCKTTASKLNLITKSPKNKNTPTSKTKLPENSPTKITHKSKAKTPVSPSQINTPQKPTLEADDSKSKSNKSKAKAPDKSPLQITPQKSVSESESLTDNNLNSNTETLDDYPQNISKPVSVSANKSNVKKAPKFKESRLKSSVTPTPKKSPKGKLTPKPRRSNATPKAKTPLKSPTKSFPSETQFSDDNPGVNTSQKISSKMVKVSLPFNVSPVKNLKLRKRKASSSPKSHSAVKKLKIDNTKSIKEINEKNPSNFYGPKAAKTPKGAKKPLPKTPKVISTKVTKTPKSTIKKTLWSEVLKKNLGKTPKATKVARIIQLEKEKSRGSKKVAKKKKPVTDMEDEVNNVVGSSTGHAASPENIVIRKRLKTPGKKGKRKNSDDSPLDLQSVSKTPANSPTVATPKSDSEKFANSLRKSLGSLSNTPGNLNRTEFDFDEAETPNITIDAFVSPLVSENNSPNLKSIKRLMKTPRAKKGTPQADYSNIKGLKRLLNTPKPPKSPKSDLSNLRGVKKLLSTPKPLAKSPKADYTKVEGLRQLMTTPKAPSKSPRSEYTDISGVKKLMTTPKATSKSPMADYTNIDGVKKLMTTPKTPANSPKSDYTDVRGVKKLMMTPKAPAKSPKADYSNVRGVKKLMATPKVPAKSPEADYTNLCGVKQLMATPRAPGKSPKADYTDIGGVKKLMTTPKAPAKSPQADYSNFAGLKKLMTTPKASDNSPKVDYTIVEGLKKLLATPKKHRSPKANYTDVAGVRELLKTPKAIQDINMEDLHVLFASPEFKNLTPKKQNNILRRLDIENILENDTPRRGRRKAIATPTTPLNVDSKVSRANQTELSAEEDSPLPRKTRGRKIQTSLTDTESDDINSTEISSAPVKKTRGRKPKTTEKKEMFEIGKETDTRNQSPLRSKHTVKEVIADDILANTNKVEEVIVEDTEVMFKKTKPTLNKNAIKSRSTRNKNTEEDVITNDSEVMKEEIKPTPKNNGIQSRSTRSKKNEVDFITNDSEEVTKPTLKKSGIKPRSTRSKKPVEEEAEEIQEATEPTPKKNEIKPRSTRSKKTVEEVTMNDSEVIQKDTKPIPKENKTKSRSTRRKKTVEEVITNDSEAIPADTNSTPEKVEVHSRSFPSKKTSVCEESEDTFEKPSEEDVTSSTSVSSPKHVKVRTARGKKAPVVATTEGESTSTEIETPPKRARGRPPKESSQLVNGDVDKKQEVKPKRGRRAKTNQEEEKENVINTITEAEKDVVTPVKSKRGRKPKGSTAEAKKESKRKSTETTQEASPPPKRITRSRKK